MGIQIYLTDGVTDYRVSDNRTINVLILQIKTQVRQVTVKQEKASTRVLTEEEKYKKKLELQQKVEEADFELTKDLFSS